eukprot:SAG25_NODE_284_length_10400_cov_5.110475_10_plen_158_part_00
MTTGTARYCVCTMWRTPVTSRAGDLEFKKNPSLGPKEQVFTQFRDKNRRGIGKSQSQWGGGGRLQAITAWPDVIVKELAPSAEFLVLACGACAGRPGPILSYPPPPPPPPLYSPHSAARVVGVDAWQHGRVGRFCQLSAASALPPDPAIAMGGFAPN